MPIAICSIAPDLQLPHSEELNLVELWALAAGVAAEEMTINLQMASRQFGKQSAVIADLRLPSLWSADSVGAIQLGLSQALCAYFSVDPAKVLVTTQIVDSGLVVENGQIETW